MAAPARRFMAFSRDWRDAATTAAATFLLAAFWWLAVSASVEKSHTSDELPHITAGYAFDRFGDFRMHPENGVLPQRLFGLAPLALDARFPMDDLRWRHSTYWQLGWDFFYALDNPLDRIVLAARALNALFGVVLGLFLFRVARAWFGRAGGLLALGFFAVSPQFLAHAGLATSDLAAATMLTLAPWFFWRHLERRDLASGLLAGLLSGLALVAKFNGVLLAPIYALLALADAWLRAGAIATAANANASAHVHGPRGRRFAVNLALAAAQAAAAVVIIWAFFNFRFSARGPGTPELVQFAWSWSEMLASLGWKRGLVEAALRWHLLPEAWLYGLTNVLAGEAARPSFFAGEHSLHGWWQFFPTLVLLKTPLAFLASLVAAAAVALATLRRATPEARRVWAVRAAPLVVSAAVVWGIALRSHLNIGDRHILAIYPVLFVAAGLLAARRPLAWLAAALLAANAATTLAIRPHYLAAFNPLGGGPAHAYRLFVDSSLDWGQDLPALRTWLAAHRRPAEKLYLGYFGSAWPPHYGVRPQHFLPTPTYLVSPPLAPYDYEPGVYAISATVLAEVYTPFRGPWTPAREASYRSLRQAVTATTPAADYAPFDRLRFARLCKFLQSRPPDAFAGYSILLFRLSADELRAALDGPVTGAHRLRLP